MWMTMLTFLVPGLGQATRGEARKAVQYFFTALIFGVLTAGIVWIAMGVLSAIDEWEHS